MDLVFGLFSVFGAIDFTRMTDGVQTAFESGVTTVLPIAGAILAAMLVLKVIRRVIRV